MKSLVWILLVLMFCKLEASDWRTADRSSANLAPNPEQVKEAVFQIYTARAFKWRGYFGVHPWISVKEKDSNFYTVYHVVGWRLNRGLPALVIEQDIPDRKWFGAQPEIIFESRGSRAEFLIEKLKDVAPKYPYANSYKAWPGPNSNTFVSFVLRNIPEIGMELPPTSIGKDWLPNSKIVDHTESKTGFQLSLFGVLGFAVGANEGVELNILGLNFGVDILRPALKLPLIGRLGMKDSPVFEMKINSKM